MSRWEEEEIVEDICAVVVGGWRLAVGGWRLGVSVSSVQAPASFGEGGVALQL